MRPSLSLVLLAAVAAFLVLAFAGVGRPDTARGDTASADVVTVLGRGVITAVPDQATVSAGVRTDAATAAGALAQNAKVMTDVIVALKRAGGKELQTQQVSLYPHTDGMNQVTGYVAQNSVSAHAKIDGAGALVDAAAAAGANMVDGPTLDVSDRDALYRDALKQAVGDARAKALALADAGGFGVGPVSSITEGGPSPQPVYAQAALAAKSDATPIEPGTQDVTADVTVTFRIR